MKTDDQTAIRKMKRNPGLIGCFDKLYKFKELFNCKTGFYLRTGILEKDIQTNRYIDTGVDPFMRFMPSLIDIGIMGECVHGRKGLCIHSGVQCYQDGLNIKQENMSLENFREIIEQVSGKIFQCALGGRGDPNKHENFTEILRSSKVTMISRLNTLKFPGKTIIGITVSSGMKGWAPGLPKPFSVPRI